MGKGREAENRKVDRSIDGSIIGRHVAPFQGMLRLSPHASHLTPRASRPREERGHSLVELVFGLGIAMAAVAAGYTVASTSDKTSVVNDQTAQLQQNVRIAMNLVSSDIKTAGFGMTGAVGACAQAIVPTDNQPAGPDTGPDSVSLVAPTPVGTLAATATAPFNVIGLTAGSVANYSGEGFGVGSVLSIGGATPATVNAVAGDNVTLATTVGLPVVYPAGTQVFWLRCITYSIGTTSAACSGNAPCLLRNGSAVAEGIEDLQLAYACDGCVAAINGGVADGIIDDQNGTSSFDTADFISNNTWATAPMTPDKIRLVRITIVGRQPRQDPNWHGTTPTTVEDHDPTGDAGYTLATYQQFRRRILTRTVQARNLGL
jgi:type IV pilus assembly protein PilW